MRGSRRRIPKLFDRFHGSRAKIAGGIEPRARNDAALLVDVNCADVVLVQFQANHRDS
jgi:hypothetical protein